VPRLTESNRANAAHLGEIQMLSMVFTPLASIVFAAGVAP
jgi:hypothetical protein